MSAFITKSGWKRSGNRLSITGHGCAVVSPVGPIVIVAADLPKLKVAYTWLFATGLLRPEIAEPLTLIRTKPHNTPKQKKGRK